MPLILQRSHLSVITNKKYDIRVLISDNKSRIVNHDITNRKFYESPTPYFKIISVTVIRVFVTPLQAGRPKNIAIELVLLDISDSIRF